MYNNQQLAPLSPLKSNDEDAEGQKRAAILVSLKRGGGVVQMFHSFCKNFSQASEVLRVVTVKAKTSSISRFIYYFTSHSGPFLYSNSSQKVLHYILHIQYAFFRNPLLTIDHFIVICSVTWPLNGSEAGGV